MDFFRPSEDDDCDPLPLGYTNILPLHLESGSGSVVLAVNNSHGFPIGQVTGKNSCSVMLMALSILYFSQYQVNAPSSNGLRFTDGSKLLQFNFIVNYLPAYFCDLLIESHYSAIPCVQT